MFFKIQKSKNDEPQSQFYQLNKKLFTLLLFNFHANYCQYQIIVHILIFSECYY